MAEFKFEKNQWEWNESYKLKKLEGSDSREVSPLVVEFNGKTHIAYVYSPVVKKGMQYLAEKIFRKEDHRRKLFVKVHGVLKNVPSELLFKMSRKDNVISNARKYGAEKIIERGKPLDYLLADYGTSANALMKKHVGNAKIRRQLLCGIGITLGRLRTFGYQPRVMNFNEFIVPDERKPLEIRLTDIFDLSALSQVGPGISLNQAEDDAEVLVLGALYIAGFSREQISVNEIISCVSKGAEKGLKEFS